MNPYFITPVNYTAQVVYVGASTITLHTFTHTQTYIYIYISYFLIKNKIYIFSSMFSPLSILNYNETYY